ncbi:MAG: hypothetical protein IJP28_06175, partial [Erysipelotrichales bacterium]|nr:hypothetical protein [Erysipelotrichales bacterium]
MRENRRDDRYTKRTSDRKNTNRREFTYKGNVVNKSKVTKVTCSVVCKEMDEDGKGVVYYQGQRYTIPTLLVGEEAEVELSQS